MHLSAVTAEWTKIQGQQWWPWTNVRLSDAKTHRHKTRGSCGNKKGFRSIFSLGQRTQEIQTCLDLGWLLCCHLLKLSIFVLFTSCLSQFRELGAHSSTVGKPDARRTWWRHWKCEYWWANWLKEAKETFKWTLQFLCHCDLSGPQWPEWRTNPDGW